MTSPANSLASRGDGRGVGRRLDSWKEIAEYLGRDVRTVIRWEKEKALPVHRIPGGKRQAVFAYTGEIQGWMLGQAPVEGGVWRAEREAGETDDGEPGAEGQARPNATLTKLAKGTPTWPLTLLDDKPRRLSYRSAMWLAAAVALLAVSALVIGGRNGSSAAAAPPLARPLQFVRSDYEASAPRGIVAGDFNGDGKTDLVFTDSQHGTVVALLGDGRGAFARRLVTPTRLKSPEHVAVGDFDGDGRPDIVLTSFYGSSEVEVLLGSGDGTFRDGALFDAGGRSRWVAVGDLNGDGKVDLVVAASMAAKIVVRIGKGDGTFSGGGEYEAEQDVSALALADVNQDGALDVIAGDYWSANGNSVSVYLNRGDGTLATRKRVLTGSGPLGLAVADLDRNGVLDIVTANYPLKCSVLLGRGDAQYAAPVDFDAGGGNGFVEVADLDRDGVPDVIVLGEHSNTASILLGDGRGRFAPAQTVPTGRYPDGVAVTDLNGDGKLDMAILSVDGNSVSVYLNRTEAATPFGSWFATVFSSIH